MARKNNKNKQKRIVRAKRAVRAHTPLTPAQIVAHLRAAICTHVGTINRRIDHNGNHHSMAAIIAAFGADASTLASYLALGQTLGVHPAGSSGQCYTSGQ